MLYKKYVSNMFPAMLAAPTRTLAARCVVSSSSSSSHIALHNVCTHPHTWINGRTFIVKAEQFMLTISYLFTRTSNTRVLPTLRVVVCCVLLLLLVRSPLAPCSAGCVLWLTLVRVATVCISSYAVLPTRKCWRRPHWVPRFFVRLCVIAFPPKGGESVHGSHRNGQLEGVPIWWQI